MDAKTNLKVVHESETQRQYPRVRIPGSVLLGGDEPRRYTLYDISAGGLSFDSGEQRYRVGERLHGELSFVADAVRFSIPVHLEVRHCTAALQRVGCCFQDVDARLVAALRHVINGTITGELVTVGNMLATLSRNNYTGPRGGGAAGGLSGLARLRALAFTGAMLGLGLAAFCYAALKLYDIFFITHAVSAGVSGPVVTIAMPRDGTFLGLIPADGKVQKGAQIGAYETAMLDTVQDLGPLRLTTEQLAGLANQQLKGTISSPCDCRVLRRYVSDAVFVNRSQPLFELLPEGGQPYVLARFHYEQIDQLAEGRAAVFRISGERHDRKGSIKQLRMPPPGAGPGAQAGINTQSTDVIAVIEPLDPLDPALIDRPADVRLGGLEPLL